MEYAIEIIHENGDDDLIRLGAVTQQAAEDKAREWAKGARKHQDSVYLAFFRPADHCRGYVNQDGCSPTGQEW